ncbi:MAG: hypothetical protein ACLGXA_21810 [Acidobacteriota bacterium]
MQLSFLLRKLSMSFVILAISAVTASAQSLSGATAILVTPLNTRTARSGQPVTAKLDDSVKLANGATLPKGTQLAGNISSVQAAEGRGAATISVVFTTAERKDGQKIPVKATLLGAYPPDVEEYSGDGYVGAGITPAHVSSQYSVDQEPGVLRGITLNAAVKDDTSGTFSKKSGNFKLDAGSYLQIAVAPAGAVSDTTSAAE